MILVQLEGLSHLFGFKFSNGECKKEETAFTKFKFYKIKIKQLLRTDPKTREVPLHNIFIKKTLCNKMKTFLKQDLQTNIIKFHMAVSYFKVTLCRG